MRAAIPAAALTLLVALLATGTPAQADPGYLGVHLQDLDDALIEALDLGDATDGVLISDVVDDSPAEEAGLRRGDVITQFDGDAVRSVRSLTRKVRRADSGDEVVVGYLRKGDPREVTVTLGESPEREFFPRPPRAPSPEMPHRGMNMFFEAGQPRLGVRVEPVGEDLGKYFGVDSGLLVLEVHEDSAAEAAGLEVGDVLLKLGDEPLQKVEDLREALADHDEGDEVALELMRDRSRTTVEVEVREPERIDIGRLMDEDHPRVFQFDTRDFPRHGRGWVERAPRARRIPPLRMDEDLQEQLDRLQEQLEKLSDEVQRLKDR
jgi:serine protease Do